MAAEIDFFFDCASPWSFIGLNILSDLKRRDHFEVRWRPVVVGGVFKLVNPTFEKDRAASSPAKVAYVRKDIADWARSLGVTMTFPPSRFPVNSVVCMRVCLAAAPTGQAEAVARGFFSAYFARDEDISDPKVLERVVVETTGSTNLLASVNDVAIKSALIANATELVDRGGFGVPTTFVGDDMYFGADRLWLAAQAIRRQASSAP